MNVKTIAIKAAHAMAVIVSSILCATLFICANTNSSVMIHQPEFPQEIDRFCKFK